MSKSGGACIKNTPRHQSVITTDWMLHQNIRMFLLFWLLLVFTDIAQARVISQLDEKSSQPFLLSIIAMKFNYMATRWSQNNSNKPVIYWPKTVYLEKLNISVHLNL